MRSVTHSVIHRIELIQKHPDTVGCINFFHKSPEGAGRNGPRLCSTYVFSIKNWVQGEGATPEAAFEDLWQQLVRIIPSLDGSLGGPVETRPAVPGLTAQPAPTLTTRIPGL